MEEDVPIVKSGPKLVGDQAEIYDAAIEAGLKIQAKIIEVEVTTGCPFIEYDTYWNKLRVKGVEQEMASVPVSSYMAKMPMSAILKYHTMKSQFDEMRVIYPGRGPDPILMGIVNMKQLDHRGVTIRLCFKIVEWD